ncbi:MAG: trigger factor [Anaerovoracaceae bacterium]|jgi:trigger factor
MKATQISKEGNNVKFNIEVTADEFKNAVIRAYQQSKDKFVIDGFRKGKAPRSIIEKHYGDDIFFDDALNDILGTAYPQAIDDLELEVIDSPKIEAPELKKGEGFVIEGTVEVYPELEIRDYKGVEIEDVDTEATDEDIQNAIDNLRRKNGRLVEVDREAKEGDTLLIDFVGTVDGKEFEGGSMTDCPLMLGSNTFIPGFEDQLVGTKAGDRRDVKVTFPEDYGAEDLAGKEAVFDCTVKKVQEEELPELDDELVQDISSYDTVDEFKEKTAEDVRRQKRENAENMMKDEAVKKVMDANDFDVPERLVSDDITAMIQEYSQQLAMQGMTLDNYLEMVGRTMEDFRNDLRSGAENRVKMRMTVRGVAEQENLEATDEDVEGELQDMADRYDMKVEDIRGMLAGQNMDMVKEDIKMRKAVQFIYDNAVKKEKKED